MFELIGTMKSLAADLLGPFYGILVTLFWAAFPFLGPHNLNALFVVSAIVIAVLYFYFRRTDATTTARTWRDALRYVFPWHLLTHPSAKLDYKFYLLNAVLHWELKFGAWVAGLAGALAVSDRVDQFWTWLFSIESQAATPGFVALVAFTLLVTVAIDFSKWAAHFLQHKIPLLWEFHKVHHSAEVLTPITNYRIHPVDFLLEQFIVAMMVGMVVGSFASFYQSNLDELTIMNIGAVFFFYYLQNNLRHSHIPIGFPCAISRILSSPHMHQVHHSAEARHFDKNFALVFSFWDELAGTNYIPERGEKFDLGLGAEENNKYRSLVALYLHPFAAGFSKLRRFRNRPA